jgi:FSR family fosmidomycin resistance protein-like MFS transporter
MAPERGRNLNEPTATPAGSEAVLLILVAASFSHLLNDTIQSLIPAIYPVLKASFQLSFAQIGLITLTFQATASLLQPLVGLYTDRRPQPFSLPVGMAFSLVGLVLLASANSYPMILAAAASVGLGSSIFHPEASRLARLASGGRYGFAQSLFQVGGNAGQSLGPLLAALVIGARPGAMSSGSHWSHLSASLCCTTLAAGTGKIFHQLTSRSGTPSATPTFLRCKFDGLSLS